MNGCRKAPFNIRNIGFPFSMFCVQWIKCGWISSESDQAKHGKVSQCGFSVESKWHGWSVRQGGRQRGAGWGTVTADFCMRHKTCCMIWGSFKPTNLSDPMKLEFEESFWILMGEFVDFWKLLLETPVAWDDTASGRPCCGTCFLSWDPKAPAFLREAFFHIQATPSLLGNCAQIPAISYWQQSYH